MRKILSIVLTLGVVLGLMLTAAPVAAKVSGVSVVVASGFDCAEQIGVYNISFTTSASLTEGVHCVCIKFPAGTVIPATGSPVPWFNGDILFDGDPVFGSEVTVTGTEVCFLVPHHYDAGAHWVYFTDDACIINPPAGKYQLEVYTCREPDSIPVKNTVPYTIKRCFSVYIWDWDANPTYPGIADGFVPPFKAGGQTNNATLGIIGAVNASGGWMNAFTLCWGALAGSLVGCNSPCDTVDIYFQLTASPQVPCGLTPSHVSLNLSTVDGAAENITMQTYTWEPCFDADGIPNKHLLADDYPLAVNSAICWDGLILFDTPGDYTICFTAECNGGPACEPPDCDNGNILSQECIDFTVHQWKDAYKIELYEKWNLISLPLVPFDPDIDAMLASLDYFDYNTYIDSSFLVAQDNLLSIWNYDAAAADWEAYATDGSQTSLTTIEDGTAYWFRMRYPVEESYYSGYGVGPLADCGPWNWWVFGTQLPEPPNSPKVYSVEAGWNMVGFTSMINEPDTDYLSNWNVVGVPAPIIFGWTNGCFAAQGWDAIPFDGTNLESGQGYWMSFGLPGFVYQVVP